MSEHEPNDLADTLFGVSRRLRWHVNERILHTLRDAVDPPDGWKKAKAVARGMPK